MIADPASRPPGASLQAGGVPSPSRSPTVRGIVPRPGRARERAGFPEGCNRARRRARPPRATRASPCSSREPGSHPGSWSTEMDGSRRPGRRGGLPPAGTDRGGSSPRPSRRPLRFGGVLHLELAPAALLRPAAAPPCPPSPARPTTPLRRSGNCWPERKGRAGAGRPAPARGPGDRPGGGSSPVPLEPRKGSAASSTTGGPSTRPGTRPPAARGSGPRRPARAPSCSTPAAPRRGCSSTGSVALGASGAEPVRRPPWDALLAPQEEG